jgi:hypothetical protein
MGVTFVLVLRLLTFKAIRQARQRRRLAQKMISWSLNSTDHLLFDPPSNSSFPKWCSTTDQVVSFLVCKSRKRPFERIKTIVWTATATIEKKENQINFSSWRVRNGCADLTPYWRLSVWGDKGWWTRRPTHREFKRTHFERIRIKRSQTLKTVTE